MARRALDPIGAYVRQDKTRRRAGAQVCSRCANADCLVYGSDPRICARCAAIERGRRPYELHHPAGEKNHPATVLVPINGHRGVLTPEMYEWPERTRENPDASPLLACAAALRGTYSTVEYLLAQLLLQPAECMETLDRALTQKLGVGYWKDLNVDEPIRESEP